MLQPLSSFDAAALVCVIVPIPVAVADDVFALDEVFAPVAVLVAVVVVVGNVVLIVVSDDVTWLVNDSVAVPVVQGPLQ